MNGVRGRLRFASKGLDRRGERLEARGRRRRMAQAAPGEEASNETAHEPRPLPGEAQSDEPALAVGDEIVVTAEAAIVLENKPGLLEVPLVEKRNQDLVVASHGSAVPLGLAPRRPV